VTHGRAAPRYSEALPDWEPKIMLSALALSVLAASLSAPPAKEPDISCELSGMYTGNAINPFFKLKITGAKKEWTYSISDDMFGRQKPALNTEHRGTYEIDGDLAVFTGERVGAKDGDEGAAVKFGLNFGFPDGKVSFDRLFPNEKGEFTYSRKWFRRKGGEWVPAKELRLTLTLPAGELPDAFGAGWKGQIVRWDKDGKRSEEAIDAKVRYKRSQGCYAPEKPAERNWEWLPGELVFEHARNKVVAITWYNRYIGDLRGFHPRYAEAAEK
jgi:hypothetical protein